MSGGPLLQLSYVMTSEHLGTARARCSWCPVTLCQWVTTDNQLQDVSSLRQEWNRQAAVEVPSANMVDLHSVQPMDRVTINESSRKKLHL